MFPAAWRAARHPYPGNGRSKQSGNCPVKRNPNLCRNGWNLAQVDRAPHHPRNASRELDTVDLGDSIIAAYGCKESLGAKPKGYGWLPCDSSNQVSCELFRFSHSELRSGRRGFPVECVDCDDTIPKRP